MRIPTIHGLIDRRLLLNFTAEPSDVQRIVPAPFRPKLYRGKAIVGICLIRLKHVKPKGLPDFLGVSSENGAHRIAVEWDEEGRVREGVYVLRRDTSLKLNAWIGGRLFPGKHHLADFNVVESAGAYHVDFTGADGTHISVDAQQATAFPPDSIFETLENVSAFFERGAVGYSPNGKRFDGLRLATYTWQVKPLAVRAVRSSFFENETLFAPGSVKFDNALLMTAIEHEWHSVASK
jgi:hypothetical protein